jgi:hypothetical protein
MRGLLTVTVVILITMAGPIQALQKSKPVTKVATEAQVDAKLKIAEKSRDWGAKVKAIGWFSTVLPPNDKVKAKVARKLIVYFADDKDAVMQEQARKAILHWASEEIAPKLMNLAEKDNLQTSGYAIIALGNIKYQKAIPLLVRTVEFDSRNRGLAGIGLANMGPVAEPAVLKLLDTKDPSAIHQACIILGQIGTKESLPALEKMSKKENPAIASAARNAIASIQDAIASIQDVEVIKAGWKVKYWKVLPDPGDTFKAPFNLEATIPAVSQWSNVFPTMPSPFVAVWAKGEENYYQVYDLRTMKAVGKPVSVPKDVSNSTPALSPDGKHLAWRVERREKNLTFLRVQVWSAETGKRVSEFGLGKEDFLDFLGRDRLVINEPPESRAFWTIGSSSKYSPRWCVFDIKTGKEIAGSEKMPAAARNFTFSSGGRYRLNMIGSALDRGADTGYQVWDLNNRKLVGEVWSPVLKGKKTIKETRGQAVGLAFSPDGEEFAILWRLFIPQKARLLVFETKTGNQLFDHRIGYDMLPVWAKHPQLPSEVVGSQVHLQWWPLRRGWLLNGDWLLDRDSGKVVHKIGQPPDKFGRIQNNCRFLDSYHITSMDESEKELKVVALPKGEIQAAVKKARAK